jgi:ribokinase
VILVVGSINIDVIAQVEHLPSVGETVRSSDFQNCPGGKGANHAVAAARLEGEVRLVGCVGTDRDGQQLVITLQDHRVDTSWVERKEGQTGIAFITVDAGGRNSIVVSSGVNRELVPSLLFEKTFEGAEVVVLQLEVAVETVKKAARLAKEARSKVILNASPMTELHPADLSNVDILVINEVECGQLLRREAPRSVDEAIKMAAEIVQLVPTVVVTLGENGAIWKTFDSEGHCQSFPVDVRDTTAAGIRSLAPWQLPWQRGRPWNERCTLQMRLAPRPRLNLEHSRRSRPGQRLKTCSLALWVVPSVKRHLVLRVNAMPSIMRPAWVCAALLVIVGCRG